MIKTELAINEFQTIYGGKPYFISRAPGRVNLIGEHTDYNGGFVLPCAINREIVLTASPRKDQNLHLYSSNFKEHFAINLSKKLSVNSSLKWQNYILAVINEFRKRSANIPGMNVCIIGDIPIGAGLSSSAAYEVASSLLLNSVLNLHFDKKNLALIAQDAEHGEFIGVQCGIMDQFASVFGKADHALLIDCYTLEHELVPFNTDDASIVIINTMVKRSLLDSEYNRRRNECDQGLELINCFSGANFPSIRHIPFQIYVQHSNKIPDTISKRLRHVITENERVLQFVDDIKNGNWISAGQLLYSSHSSLRDDYEVSTEQLNFIVETARAVDGAYGARMTGAGFGGCAIALVKPSSVESFSAKLKNEYRKKFSIEPEIYISPPSEGASILTLAKEGA